MNQNLSYYESVAQTSAQMLEAARRQDWDALIEAERYVSGTSATLKAAGGDDHLAPDARKRKAEIIRTVLAYDAEIRRLVDPRMNELELLLSSAAKKHRVDNAYRWLAPDTPIG